MLIPHAAASGGLETIGTPTLWAGTIGAVVALLALDFVITRKPHAVSMKEAVGWSVFYVALPLSFGAWIWSQYGQRPAWSTSPATSSRSR